MKRTHNLAALLLLAAANSGSALGSEPATAALTITTLSDRFCRILLDSASANVSLSALQSDQSIGVGTLTIACNDWKGFTLSVTSKNEFELVAENGHDSHKSNGRRDAERHDQGVPYVLIVSLPEQGNDHSTQSVLLDTSKRKRFTAERPGPFGAADGQALDVRIKGRIRKINDRRGRDHWSDGGERSDTVTFEIAPAGLSRSSST